MGDLPAVGDWPAKANWPSVGRARLTDQALAGIDFAIVDASAAVLSLDAVTCPGRRLLTVT